MATDAFDSRVRMNQIFWFGLVFIAVSLLGFFLAYDSFTAVFASIGLIWLGLLPYHSKLAVYLAVSTFSSAIIIPFFPGRPLMWEFAAFLGWSGLVITISMRQYTPDFNERFHEARWLFIGILGYCLTLFIIMFYRGVGLRILGSGQMGGRFYFQQLLCAIFPLLFIMCRPSEKALVRLFILQCLLTATFLISEFAWAFMPKQLDFLLRFFELSGDAVSFDVRATQVGLRRFQSLREISQGLYFLILVAFSLKMFTQRSGFFLVPTVLGILVMGALSGHRILLLITLVTTFFCMIAQRFFTPRNILLFSILGIVSLTLVYVFVDSMPLAAQRAVSFLPGISVQQLAAEDGYGTLVTRKILREIGMEMIPQYMWIGRGFGLTQTDDFSVLWDPTQITFHLNQGRFFNGFIGLMVNTGLTGTLSMLIILLFGTVLSWKIIKNLQILGAEEPFLRMCGVVAGLWMASTVSFLFLHGDSEYALKTFSLQIGIMLVCFYHLNTRLKKLKVEASVNR